MIYLDNSATTRPTEAVRAAVMRAMEDGWFNPSALYRPAMEAEHAREDARKAVLDAAGAAGHKLVFTGSGTEADNLAILGYLRTVRRPGRVLILQVEHPAVAACAEEITRMGHRVEQIPVDRSGMADLDRLDAMLDERVLLICVMQVNNETGAVQPLAEIVRLRNAKAPAAAIHVDGVQGFLRVPLQFDRLGIQSYALSGHKIHALKGIGALILRRDHRVQPIVHGGGQEGGLRSGTENMPGILSLAEAVRTWPGDGPARMAALRERLWQTIRAAVPDARVNGPQPGSPASAPHILNISLPPVRSQTMLFALEGDGVYVSAGSACASHKQKLSPVLGAMGLEPALADSALRFSLNPFLTEEEIDGAAASVIRQYDVLKKYVRR